MEGKKKKLTSLFLSSRSCSSPFSPFPFPHKTNTLAMALSGNVAVHTVATTPFEGQKPGTSGLRKKVKKGGEDGDDGFLDGKQKTIEVEEDNDRRLFSSLCATALTPSFRPQRRAPSCPGGIRRVLSTRRDRNGDGFESPPDREGGRKREKASVKTSFPQKRHTLRKGWADSSFRPSLSLPLSLSPLRSPSSSRSTTSPTLSRPLSTP